LSNKAYSFKGIKINLTNRDIETIYLNKQYIQYLGGRGLNNILLLEGMNDKKN